MDPKKAKKLAEETIVFQTMGFFNKAFAKHKKDYDETRDVDWKPGHERQFERHLFAMTFTNLVLDNADEDRWNNEKACVKDTADKHAELTVQRLRVNGSQELRFDDVMATLPLAKTLCVQCFDRLYSRRKTKKRVRILGWICNF